MPNRRRVQKGSFGSHLDELVANFSANEPEPPAQSTRRDPKLQRKIDIHAMLFERAWELDGQEAQRPATNSQIEKARSPAAGGS